MAARWLYGVLRWIIRGDALQYTHRALFLFCSFNENRAIDQMTLRLSDVLHDKRGGLFISLLNEWGAWSRSGAMPQSLRRANHHNSYDISDDDALKIDRAMARLKTMNVLLFECLRCEYIFHLSMKSIKAHLVTSLTATGDTRTASTIKSCLNRILFEQALSKAEAVLLELLESDTRQRAKHQHKDCHSLRA